MANFFFKPRGKERQNAESLNDSPAANPPDGTAAVNELVNGIDKMLTELASALSNIRDAAGSACAKPAGDADGRLGDGRRARPAEDEGRKEREDGQPVTGEARTPEDGGRKEREDGQPVTGEARPAEDEGRKEGGDGQPVAGEARTPGNERMEDRQGDRAGSGETGQEDYAGKIDRIIMAISGNEVLTEEAAALSSENRELRMKLAEKQERLENILQSVQEDRYRKDKIKLINKYIYHIDLIRQTLYDFNSARDSSKEKDPETVFLERQLEETAAGLEAVLMQEMVEKVQTGKNGGTVDPEMQETVETVPTNDPGMDGKIFRSLSPAYVWTLPYILKPRISDTGEEVRSYRFLIRPEQIITYKLKK